MASERCPGCGGYLAEGLELCTPCKAKRREDQDRAKNISLAQAKAKDDAVQRTIQAFPEVIRETDPAKLDDRMKAVVDAYTPDARESWILFGATRVGKTRTAYCLALRFSQIRHQPATFLTMRRFEALVERSFRDKRHSEALDAIIEAPFLVLDDFGKEKMTERLAVDLFAIIDERTGNRRPTVITTNLTGDALEAKLAAIEPNLASALVARLREFFRKASAF